MSKKCLLSTYYVPSTVLGTGNIPVKQSISSRKLINRYLAV